MKQYTTVKEALWGTAFLIIGAAALSLPVVSLVGCGWFDSPTEPFISELTTDFECDRVRISGATIFLTTFGGACEFRCVDLTFGGVLPYRYEWVTSSGDSTQSNPSFQVTLGENPFTVRLEVTDDDNRRDIEDKFFQIVCSLP